MKKIRTNKPHRHGMKNAVAFALALGVSLSMPMSVMAETWDLFNGSITVDARDGFQYVSQGNTRDHQETSETIITQNNASMATKNNLTINANAGQTAEVTLSGVNIEIDSYSEKAAVETSGAGNVSIELDGDNTLKSEGRRAGLEKGNAGKLSINDMNGYGSLSASGDTSANAGGAGIGGQAYQDGDNIEINGGKITANGGNGAAGIGGGSNSSSIPGGNGTNIAIHGGDVTATGYTGGAGIGGGSRGSGTDITISGGKVTAAGGGNGGAGIGGGSEGDGENILISSGEVNATAKNSGAGIGGGSNGKGASVTISGDAKVNVKIEVGKYANPDNHGAMIGHGQPAGTSSYSEDWELKEGNGGLDTSYLYTTGSITRDTNSTTVHGKMTEEEVKSQIPVQTPEIHNEPQVVTASTEAGTTATLSVAAESPDNGTLTYQWFANGQPISGETGSSLTVSEEEYQNSVYKVVVTNSRTEKGITNSNSWTSGEIRVPAEEPVQEPSEPIENPTEEPEVNPELPPAEEPENLPPEEEPQNLPPAENTSLPPAANTSVPPSETVVNASAAPYKVKIAQPANGTITTNVENAKAGDTVEITATPDEGYVLKSVSVMLDGGQLIPVTEVGAGAYTFVMPNGHVTISAEFIPEAVPQSEVDTAENLPPAEETNLPPAEDANIPPTEETNLPPAEETNLPPAEETNLPPAEETNSPSAAEVEAAY